MSLLFSRDNSTSCCQKVGLLVELPNALAVSSQRKLRAKPMHEIQVNLSSKKTKKLNMNSYEYQLTTTSKKLLYLLWHRVKSQHCITTIWPQESDIFGSIPMHLQSQNFMLHCLRYWKTKTRYHGE